MANESTWWPSDSEQPALEAIPNEEITEILLQYPYFSHAYWWMAKKSQQEGALQRAAVFAYYPKRLQTYVKAQEMAYADPLSAQEPEVFTGISHPETAPVQEDAPASIIQPLFSQDYFAYTGTRLPSELDNDKRPTMEQLRSFTDWLRALKRPPQSGSDLDPDLQEDKASLAARQEQLDSSVKQSAEDSIRVEDEVYTEAMAEVRVKQGQVKKAIAIYEKLGLLNPEKSSYFAGKVQRLKNI